MGRAQGGAGRFLRGLRRYRATVFQLVGLEQRLQLDPRLASAFDQRVAVVVEQVLGGQDLFVVPAETTDPRVRLFLAQTQAAEHHAAHLQAGEEGLAHRLDPGVEQQVDVLAVTRASDDLQVRIQLAHALGRLDVGLRVIGGDDEELGLLYLGRAKDLRAHRVAVEDRDRAEGTGQLDGLHRGVQGDERHALGAQHASDDLAHAADPGDHHARGVVVVDAFHFRRRLRRLRLLRQQARETEYQQRGQGHRQGDGKHQQVVQVVLEQALVAGHLEHDEGELAAGRQDHAQAQRRGLVEAAGNASDEVQHRRLQGDQQHGQAEHHPRRLEQQADIRAHPHADEEQAEQQALERLDLRLQFVAVLRVGQQQAGEEGTEGHGHAGQLHQQRGTHHHQQRGGGGHVLQLGLGDDAKHRAQQVAATDHHRGDAADHLEGLGQFAAAGVAVRTAEQRDHGDQRDRRDVLEQQDGEGQAAMGLGQFLALGEDLQAEGGGRQRQAQAEHHRAVHRLVEADQGHSADHQAGQQHLQQADAEHRLAHHPQAPRRQLQADDEQQQYHAHLGDLRDAFRVVHQAQHAGTDQHAGQQVAEHRAQLQALGQRHHEHRRDQEDHAGLEKTASVFHAQLPLAALAPNRSRMVAMVSTSMAI